MKRLVPIVTALILICGAVVAEWTSTTSILGLGESLFLAASVLLLSGVSVFFVGLAVSQSPAIQNVSLGEGQRVHRSQSDNRVAGLGLGSGLTDLSTDTRPDPAGNTESTGSDSYPTAVGPPGTPQSSLMPGPLPRAVANHIPSRGLKLSLDDAILSHLVGLPRAEPGATHAAGYSQEGISLALQVPQGRVSVRLRKLVDGHWLDAPTKQHVDGKASRLKVYTLTQQGRTRAMDVRRQVISRTPRSTAGAPALGDEAVSPTRQ